MMSSYNSRVKELNKPLLDRIIQLRREIKNILGYKTWFDYQTGALLPTL